MEKIYGQFDLETIEKLADIIESRELSEITITDGDKTITVKGKRTLPQPPAFVPAAAPAGLPVPPPPAPAEGKAPAQAPAAAENSGNIVKAPIVGTFYASPSPDKPPFVKIGDKVKKGDVIMIIESMKLMNEIQSEFDGTVERLLVSDGQAVEYDQPVMIIK